MNIEEVESSSLIDTPNLPGVILAEARQAKNLTKEHIAGKLHLRVAIIDQLEADDYQNMPEPVFIKGYLRAYAKLLGIDPEPLLLNFKASFKEEQKFEKALWQSKRESHMAEHAIKWIAVVFALGVIIAVSIWWHTNKDNETYLSPTLQTSSNDKQMDSEVRLTDLSKMRNMLATKAHYQPLENLRD